MVRLKRIYRVGLSLTAVMLFFTSILSFFAVVVAVLDIMYNNMDHRVYPIPLRVRRLVRRYVSQETMTRLHYTYYVRLDDDVPDYNTYDDDGYTHGLNWPMVTAIVDMACLRMVAVIIFCMWSTMIIILPFLTYITNTL